MGLGLNQESPLGVWGTQKSWQEPIRLMSQHMDMQMLQQQWMEAQAMGDIYKNGCKNYCVCVCVCWGLVPGPTVDVRSSLMCESVI